MTAEQERILVHRIRVRRALVWLAGLVVLLALEAGKVPWWTL